MQNETINIFICNGGGLIESYFNVNRISAKMGEFYSEFSKAWS